MSQTRRCRAARSAIAWLCVSWLFLSHPPQAVRAFPTAVATSVAADDQVRAQQNPRRPLRPDAAVTERETSGSLFENVAKLLCAKYYDEGFRSEQLPGLAARYAERAARASTLGEQRQVVHEFLSQIPASHLGLLSRQSFRFLMYDLFGLAYPTFGVQVVTLDGECYALYVFEGGPAWRAGVRTWDRIVSIDGVPAPQSSRVDWRTDDAYLPDDRDPPVHYLTAAPGDTVRVILERRPGRFEHVTLRAEEYSAFEAAKASARVLTRRGRTVGYLHFWCIHATGVPALLREKLDGQFRTCDGIILDLRGRGGSGAAVAQILQVLRADGSRRHRPVVALVDRQSRSAKDVLAYELKATGLARIVGERTAGAVMPATFADVGHESILMFPRTRLPRYSDLLELKPVEPDVFVERAGPFSAGNDPILDAGLADLFRAATRSAAGAGSPQKAKL